MTDWDEKMCQLCTALGGLYHRRERMIMQGETESASVLETPIHQLILDIRGWLEKGPTEE